MRSLFRDHCDTQEYIEFLENFFDIYIVGRRRKLLEHQKERRTDALNIARALVVGDLENDSEEDEDTAIETMDTNLVKEYYDKKLRVRKSYKKQLMLSEWLVQVPDDLFTNWTMVAVPEGKVNIWGDS